MSASSTSVESNSSANSTTALNPSLASERTSPITVRAKLSAAVAAIVLYLCGNLLTSFCAPSLAHDLFAWQNHDACWWTVKNFKDSQGHADVLLLGSSLMCRVVNEGDATYLKRPVNALGHFRSQHLEDALSAGQSHHYQTISLAVGGMNASDVSTLVPPLLTTDKLPSAIVYGIGPRDLFDNSLESAADAPAFRLAEKLQSFDSEVQKNARPSREAQFKLAINRILQFALPLYRFQDELSVALRRQSLIAINALVPEPRACSIQPLSTIQKAQLHLVPADMDNTCLVKPDDPVHPDIFDFNNNYFMSYNPFRPALYRRQLFFLDRFLKFGTEDGIKIILVKMPLRADNLTLMVPNFYSLYNQDIDRLARANGAVVVDASKTAKFSDSDFTDTVHLSGGGACKLIDALAPIVARNVSAPTKTSN